MDHLSGQALEQFRDHVATKFQLYNSLFTSLPFHRIEKTGILLALFLDSCEEGYRNGLSPLAIVTEFFERFTLARSPKERTDLLFRFVQYVERQVVLFDALEDAAFDDTHDLEGAGTMKEMENRASDEEFRERLEEKLKDFAVAIVLTAHPTQFYPGPVLGIINDLSKALKENKVHQIDMYLRQLGKTPLLKKQKPTPYDEAMSLVWYLERVFYRAGGRIVSRLCQQFPHLQLEANPIIRMGFWPGGDRDGNPNVDVDTTLKVAESLRSAIIKCYYLDVRRLRHRLTFKGIDEILAPLEEDLYRNIFIPGSKTDLSSNRILDTLQQIRRIVDEEHGGLFLSLVDQLIVSVEVFGLHFASLDLRQESSVHHTTLEALATEGLLPANYASLDEDGRIQALFQAKGTADPERHEGLVKDTLQSFGAVRTIQSSNGPLGCYRYMISQCGTALNVLEVYALFLLNGWQAEELEVDIVPLFETVDDLRRAPEVMKKLYGLDVYRRHLERRRLTQTIMVGFSDGTKDGGYLMANWSIYKAKEELSRISKEAGIEVIFFDGRGGPPARGGGKTHKYYASMGKRIDTREIHLTVQGQTISSNFGNVHSAQFNIEQLLNAGLTNELSSDGGRGLHGDQEAAIRELAEAGYRSYTELKEDPLFLEYLAEVSPLNYYSDTNISSRPAKRGKTGKLSLKDLRAIPFVGAWSQLKQNVPGFYGVGTALKSLDEKGSLDQVQELYRKSPYFKALMDNCEMSMKKSFFPLTAYLAGDPKFGPIWNRIRDEYELTKDYLFRLSGHSALLSDDPVGQLSIQMREKIVLPLLTIQQYALTLLRGEESAEDERSVLERLVVRTSFGIINAGRNSV